VPWISKPKTDKVDTPTPLSTDPRQLTIPIQPLPAVVAAIDPYNVNLGIQSLARTSATGESGSKKVEVTMDLVEHPNKRFMAKYHRYEPKVKDSTAVKFLKLCARKYFYTIVLGRVSLEDEVIFAWGSAYHVFREILEKEYGYGPDAPVRYDETKAAHAFVKAHAAGMKHWKEHGKDQEPEAKYGFMTAGRLFLSFKAAFKHWENEKKIGRIKVIAVEAPLIVQLADGSYTGGKADQIIRVNGKSWGRDFKTTTIDLKYYPRSLEPNDQFTRYTLMEEKVVGERLQGQFVEVLYNNKPTKKESKGPLIDLFTTERTPYQLNLFEQENVHWNRILELNREHDIWPMQENACWNCIFHSVCKKGSEEGMMSQLEQFFKVRPWDFTRIGED
jgi:hypothetical protein